MKSRLCITLTLLAASNAALAHPGHGVAEFSAGFAHPFTGLDHLLAMVAVGLWAAQMHSSAAPGTIWRLPLAFLFGLIPGAAWALLGGALPFAETGIATSVLALGVVIALAQRLPLTYSVAMTLLFGICHGHAHGVAMLDAIAPVAYAAGFLCATALLHLSGIALGRSMRGLLRRSGMYMAGIGVYLLM